MYKLNTDTTPRKHYNILFFSGAAVSVLALAAMMVERPNFASITVSEQASSQAAIELSEGNDPECAPVNVKEDNNPLSGSGSGDVSINGSNSIGVVARVPLGPGNSPNSKDCATTTYSSSNGLVTMGSY